MAKQGTALPPSASQAEQAGRKPLGHTVGAGPIVKDTVTNVVSGESETFREETARPGCCLRKVL